MRSRLVAAVSLLVAVSSAFGGAARAEGGLDLLDQVRQAKVGLSWFVLNHLDRPTRIAQPCPTLPPEAAARHVAALGSVPSVRPYGPAVVVDEQTGSGVAVLRCGNDLSRSPDPAGSVSIAIDVFMLDGQATFDQVAVVLGGNDVVVDASADPAGELAGRCRDGGSQCNWALNVDGLVVIVRAVGLPRDTGEQLTRQLVAAVTPDVIANLAAYAAATT